MLEEHAFTLVPLFYFGQFQLEFVGGMMFMDLHFQNDIMD